VRSEQPSLLDWSPVTKARKRGPETSKAAARRAQPGCSAQCDKLLLILVDVLEGLTRDQIVKASGLLNQSACGRLKEMQDGGFVEVRGTREGPFGDQVGIYHATSTGQARAKVLRDLSKPKNS
jgi:hypothetical protein